MLAPYNSSRLVRLKLQGEHLNHFGILGSSPPESREGSLYKCKYLFIFKAYKCDIRLVMKNKVLFDFGWAKICEGERSLNEG